MPLSHPKKGASNQTREDSRLAAPAGSAATCRPCPPGVVS